MDRAADAVLGWPYKPLGRGPSGVDCFGVVLAFYRLCGINASDPLTADPARVLEFALASEWRRTETPRDGDVVSFKSLGAERHVGVWLGGRILQTAKDKGVVFINPGGVIMPGQTVAGYYEFEAAP
jgi:hypothetical protein